MNGMDKSIIQKMHIIGSVGSGKTTLARRLSVKLSLPFHELDNVVWKRNKSGDIRRSEEERDSLLEELVHTTSWIIEGAHHSWIEKSLQRADLIILLDSSYRVRTCRIIRRFIRQKVGIERANYRPTFNMLKKMFAGNRSYEYQHRKEINTLLEPFNDKIIILKTNKEITKLVKAELLKFEEKELQD